MKFTENNNKSNMLSRIYLLFRSLSVFCRRTFHREKGVRHTDMWKGEYVTWEEAAMQCGGYSTAKIVKACKDALLKVKNGEAAYERDSVLFDEIQYSWVLLTGLQLAAARNNGCISVADFGGSLGSSYFQNRLFLARLKECKWNIIEQESFVKTGREYFADETLTFFEKIDDCVYDKHPNVLVLSGVAQYLKDPHDLLDQILRFNFDVIIIDRTAFIEGAKDLLTIQKVPNHIYTASYPSWFFSRDRFMAHFSEGYDLLARAPWWCDPPMYINGHHQASWDGLIFVRKDKPIS
jgi:putative methyltransferase (TIGR04325 family)